MNFNKHYGIKSHAFLAPSTNSWLNYGPEDVIKRYDSSLAAQKGTELHALAEQCIKNRIKLAPLKKAIHQFVNDAIGYGMEPEVVLYYSDFCYGTADAILYTATEDGTPLLRIHDLKTGRLKVKMDQLEVYAALFCLEYDVQPDKIEMELRIYQGTEVLIHEPAPARIRDVMIQIKEMSSVLETYISELA